jgi:hypothetical protein
MSTSNIFDEFDQSQSAVNAAFDRAEIAKMDFIQHVDLLRAIPLRDIHFSKSSDHDFAPFQASPSAHAEFDVSDIHSSVERLLTECRTWLDELDKRNKVYSRMNPSDRDRLSKIHQELETDTTLQIVSPA